MPPFSGWRGKPAATYASETEALHHQSTRYDRSLALQHFQEPLMVLTRPVAMPMQGKPHVLVAVIGNTGKTWRAQKHRMRPKQSLLRV